MRAGRVLSILLLLQNRGRLSATEIARELEISVRTVYRDVEQLSAAGVPIYAERGRDGGFALLEGWQTRLTGLTASEAQALFLGGLAGPAADLGLGDAAGSAQRKVVASLGQAGHGEVERMSSRFHLDPVGWFSNEEAVDHLGTVAEALWSDRRLTILYSSWSTTSERVVEPLGLVLKAGRWYLVARSAGATPRTYRVGEIRHAVGGGTKFRRPKRFDLGTWWIDHIAAFEASVYTANATVRLSPTGFRALLRTNAIVADGVSRSASEPDSDGWVTARVPIESVAHAADELIKLGGDVVVIAPQPLRTLMTERVAAMSALYAS